MNSFIQGVGIALVAGLLTAGCAESPQTASKGQLSSSSKCYGSGNFSACRLKHDLAGGYPIVRGGPR